MPATTLSRTIVFACALASGCLAQVDERCTGTALDHPPRLLGKWKPVQDAARSRTHERTLVFRLTVTETGSVRDVVIQSPAQLAGADDLKSEILKLRFCPAVRYSRYTETRPEFNIQLK
jgi:hypothetical protein